MILIHKNTDNNVVVTLKDSTTIEDPVYTLLITSNENTSQTLITLVDDISINIARYNQFLLNDPTDIDIPTGWYDYFIFESVGTFNQATDKIIEGGKLKVKDGNAITTPSFTPSQEEQIYTFK
jgi:hypothetical protein